MLLLYNSSWLVCVCVLFNEMCVQCSGVLHQVAASSIANIHSGDDLTFTCKPSANSTIWRTTLPSQSINNSVCVAIRNSFTNEHKKCGPMDKFTVGSVEDGDFYSTLSAKSVSSILNETRADCTQGDVNQTIHVIGK